MKKVLLSLAFVLATSSIINANSSKKEVLSTSEKSIDMIDAFSCLTDAYNFANELEEISPGGAYSWTHQEWSQVFNNFFSLCRLQEN